MTKSTKKLEEKKASSHIHNSANDTALRNQDINGCPRVERYVVICGISDYKAINDLEYSDDDARSLRDILRARLRCTTGSPHQWCTRARFDCRPGRPTRP